MIKIPDLCKEDLQWIFQGMQADRDETYYFDIETFEVFLSTPMYNFISLKTRKTLIEFSNLIPGRHFLLPHLLFVDFRSEFLDQAKGNELFEKLMKEFSIKFVKDMMPYADHENQILFTMHNAVSFGEYLSDNATWTDVLFNEYVKVREETETNIAQRWLNGLHQYDIGEQDIF